MDRNQYSDTAIHQEFGKIEWSQVFIDAYAASVDELLEGVDCDDVVDEESELELSAEPEVVEADDSEVDALEEEIVDDDDDLESVL